MSRCPLAVVIVPTKSSSGRRGSGWEPSGTSLSSLSRAGRRRFRTTASCRASSSASGPIGVFKYMAAVDVLPFCAALRKPRTAPRGVLRPRASFGASGFASGAVNVGTATWVQAAPVSIRSNQTPIPVPKRILLLVKAYIEKGSGTCNILLGDPASGELTELPVNDQVQ